MTDLGRVKVLDMSHALAGPYCGMLLGDLGAQVIKVEHPHGDHFRPLLGGAYHAAVNRNKRDISLDLKRPEAIEIVMKLVVDFDVLIESFSPGTMERLGLGYEDVAKINPKIIYCSISGFGQTGPYQKLPGYDVVAQAMCGIMNCTGEPGRPPVRVGASWIDMGAGMYAIIGILKAILDRQETGKGQRLDISLMDTALSWMSPLITRYSMSGELPSKSGSALAAFSPYQVFKAQDGFLFIGASNQRFWNRLCQMLDMEHLLEDPRFATNSERVKNRSELTTIIEKALAGISREDMVRKLRDAGIPCGPVFDIADAVNDQHVRQRGVLLNWEHPKFGLVTQVKTPIVSDGQMPEVRTPAPAVGENTRQILSELGYRDTEIEEFVSSGVAVADSNQD